MLGQMMKGKNGKHWIVGSQNYPYNILWIDWKYYDEIYWVPKKKNSDVHKQFKHIHINICHSSGPRDKWKTAYDK